MNRHAGAVRFFHRHPPNRSHLKGVNLFDHEPCVPGQWVHVVAVKTTADLSLYVNGTRVRHIVGAVGSDDRLYQILIGQMERDTTLRQFVGAMDEMALYSRALSHDEIRHHFRRVARPK